MRFFVALRLWFGLALAACGGAPPAGPSAPTPAIRGPAGQIALRTIDGRPTTLAAYGSQVTVVALWASYCGPCLAELPYIEALHEMYRNRPDVSVITVNLDDTRHPSMRDEVRGILERLAVDDTPCLLGGDPVMERLTFRDATGQPRLALPLLVVVDPAFRLHRRIGFLPGTPRGAYLADKAALIEAALRGDEPDDSPPPAL